MSVIKTSEQIEKMRISGALLTQCLDLLVACAKPGCSGKDLDTIAEEFIKDHKAIPAFKNYGDSKNPFPASICFSRNSTVVHGIPKKDQIIQEGDLITIDCGLKLDEWFADAARLFGIGEVKQEDKDILIATEVAIKAGVGACTAGNALGDIGRAIYLSILHSSFYSILEFCGHSIGQKMHEEPQVLNAGVKGQGLELKPGMVLCLEPMLKKTKTALGRLPDGWTVATRDGTRATHIEYMILITNTKPEILAA